MGSGFLSLLSWIATVYLGVGIVRYMLNLIDNKKTKLKDIFYGIDSVEHLAYVILVGIVTAVIVFAGTLLFIIPGIIASVGLMFAKYYIAENRGEVKDALKKSWQMTKGYKWKLFGLLIVVGLFNILGFFAFVIGLVVTIPISTLVLMLVYRKLDDDFVQEDGVELVTE